MTELGLAERLGISRTPVRLALSALEREGLLEAQASGGFAVRQFSLGDIHDAIDLRGVLEGTAARLAAERPCPPAALDRLGRLGDAMERLFASARDDADLFETYAELNSQFHRAVLEASGSAILIRTAESVLGLPFASPNAFVPARTGSRPALDSLREGQVHHLALIEAITGHEGARAEALAREHARLARRDLKAALASPADAGALPIMLFRQEG